MNIYFICTGNTCRSPLAEALLNHANVPGLTAKSAGIHAMDGLPISVNSAQLLTEAGISFTPYSNELKASEMEWADLVLTMTASHRDFLHSRFPEMKEKVFTLKEYAGAVPGTDVHDPYGGHLATYRTTFNELTELIDSVIRQLAEGNS
ncbi:low molecular weight phosphatase family protein [Sporosarcina sp. P37]|uniref:low molecular weight protein arginine phosphatase n=1 Tax=unclassified Sporosarcina TaxID=2647733 RepID=UPI0009BEC91A|nr:MULTISPECIES: low molecular weight protein arginine phosphatase [unclassified Sporosarcina]ARD48783.1 phosphatase [Sporosarcina sp. P33]ARK25285.1 low molecular weight phosphatase family protein [Sporosarcina sp. P37]PID17837.1 low molecular weight protein arginine phosphatase [Sporosarcina sp. P35]